MGTCIFPCTPFWPCNFEYFRINELVARRSPPQRSRWSFFLVHFQVERPFEKIREKYASLSPTRLPKNVQLLFMKNVEESRSLRVVRHTRRIFNVQRLNTGKGMRVVDLEKATCSCGFFSEYGIPCRHLCAASLFVDDHPQRFVIPQRQAETLKETYQGEMISVDTNLLFDNELKPPVIKRPRGRPKEKRFVSASEQTKKKTVTCSLCHVSGHNSRTCKMKKN